MSVKRETVAERKALPLASGVLDYFPDALLVVAEVSRVGNEQHHPGQPLHWDKSKSSDEADALLRHLLDRGTLDTDGLRHSGKVAWRALAMLQRELDAEAADAAVAAVIKPGVTGVLKALEMTPPGERFVWDALGGRWEPNPDGRYQWPPSDDVPFVSDNPMLVEPRGTDDWTFYGMDPDDWTAYGLHLDEPLDPLPTLLEYVMKYGPGGPCLASGCHAYDTLDCEHHAEVDDRGFDRRRLMHEHGLPLGDDPAQVEESLEVVMTLVVENGYDNVESVWLGRTWAFWPMNLSPRREHSGPSA